MIKHQCFVEELNFNTLSETEKELLRHAEWAAKNAYAPYSKFCVGTAARLETNEILWANNQENPSFPEGICAERALFFYLGSIQKTHLVQTLAIYFINKKQPLLQPAFPCGGCRQVLAEYERKAQKEWTLLLKAQSETVYKLVGVGKTLLPFQFIF